METEPLDRLERLFRDARRLPVAERAAFLDAACADDSALRTEVESLLAADAVADGGAFLDRPATALLGGLPAGDGAPDDALLGRHVGPYRVLRLLGEGGMGTVYLAVREEPFVQHVALKVVRAGLATPDVRRRFEQERQILASLSHAGIARLLDGGATEDGRPYVALEYVEGRPITAYCDARRLPVEARLALFEQACAAVHYAHQNLVLHRDLKPSNILVADGPDGRPAVKLLDFGIAKLLDPGPEPAAATRTGLRAMTPEYASPEQVRGDPLTTASDVYSLGVVLYELLAGHGPYRLTRGSADELVRVVCEQDPERPSTAVARDRTVPRPDGSAEVVMAAAVGAARAASPERLRRRLRGDLDTIALMALRKEAHRRYPSAEALAHDLERYRRGRPVLAHRDSRAYRLRKLLRRHPAEAALVVVVAAAVLGFALFASSQARRVAAERDRARVEQAKTAQVSAFLVGLFRQADPTAAPGDTLTVREVLDAGAARVETELAGQPEVQAAVLAVIADAYGNLGRPARATPLLERALALRREALGDGHPETAAALRALAAHYDGLGDLARAEPFYRAYLAAAERLHGPQSPAVVAALYHLATLLHMRGAPSEEAHRLFGRWRALLDAMPEADAPDLAASLGGMADLLATQRRFAEAEPYARRALAMDRRLAGDVAPSVGTDLNRLAWIVGAQDRPAEAERLAREAVAVHRTLYPEGHDALGESLVRLGDGLREQGRFDEAEALFREDLALRQRLYPRGHHTVARAHAMLGRLAHERRAYDAAEQHYRSAVAVFTALFGADFLTTVQHRLELADVLHDRGDHAAAEQLLRADLATLRRTRGRDDRTTQRALVRLVWLYEATGRPGEAARYGALLTETGRAALAAPR